MLVRVIAFYGLAFVLTIVLGGGQQAAGLSQETVILAQWGPGLAALAMLLLFRSDSHRITVFDRTVRASRYVLAALIPMGGALLVFAINRLTTCAPGLGGSMPIPWALLLWFPLGALGEELGWRGYLHKRLNAGVAGLASSLIVGPLWALWHVGMYQNGVLYLAFFVLLMVSYTVVIYALVADVGFNVLVASLFHLMINVTNLLFYSVINDARFILVSSLVWAGIALAMVLTRKTLFTAGRVTP